eukprot:362948-Chlamydomonas_euryale.AAC.10
MDPDTAAKRRAMARQAGRSGNRGGRPAGPLGEVADAEEDDPMDEHTGYNEAGQPIPLEPFNLLRERDEGYFDEMVGLRAWLRTARLTSNRPSLCSIRRG